MSSKLPPASPAAGSVRTLAVDVGAWALAVSLLVVVAAGAAWVLDRVIVSVSETATEFTAPSARQLPIATPPTGPIREVDGVLIRNPSWAVQPTPEYPLGALNFRIEGEVNLRCASSAGGRVGACETLSETPKGYGFADAAKAGTRNARLHPRTLDGVPTKADVQFVIRFRLPEDGTPAPDPR